MDNTIGVIIVCYNTRVIISEAVMSVCDHVDRVYIIDNSDKENDCYAECDRLTKIDNVSVFHTHANIGHGPALNIGVELLDTEYIICMDSDAVLLDPTLIKDMRDALDDDSVYGSGWVLNRKTGKPYLHLPFCMFKKTVFNAHPKFVHGGAPFIGAMEVIQENGLRLADIPYYNQRLRHGGRGTRMHNPDWRKSFGGREGI